MQVVRIRRCPTNEKMRRHTEDVVAALKGLEGVEVIVADGEVGDFTVAMHGLVLVRKEGNALPGVTQVLEAVRNWLPASVG